MMVAMAGLQVFIVRFFFQGARKGMHLMVPYKVKRHKLIRGRLCIIILPESLVLSVVEND